MPVLILPPPPSREFRDNKPEVGSSIVSRRSNSRRERQQECAKSLSTMKNTMNQIDQNNQQLERNNNLMKSKHNRLATSGDRWRMSSGDRMRRGNIFLRSTNESKGIEDIRGDDLNEAHSQGNQPPVRDPRYTCCHGCCRKQNSNFSSTNHHCTSNNLYKQQPKATTRQELLWPKSNFISSSPSATSVCLLKSPLSSATKLPLQLVLIMVLIMIPMFTINLKCPNVLLAMAAAPHRHHLPSSPSPAAAAAAETEAADATNKLEPPPFYNDGLKTLETSPTTTMGGNQMSNKNSPKLSELSLITKAAEAAASDTTRRAVGPGNRKRSKRTAGPYELGLADCSQFSAFWNFFRASYPSLAQHLTALATTLNDHHHSIVGQASKTIARILDEAEQVAVHDQQANSLRSAPTSGGGVSSAWLAKIKANPYYSRIIQNFNRNKQLASYNKQQQQNHHHSTPEKTLEIIGNGDQKQLDSLMPSPQQAASSSSSSGDDPHVYGRIIHYPREANNEASKTLDKLKQLNQQRHHAQQPAEVGRSQLNDIDRLAGGGDNAVATDDIESNRIPLVAGDGEEQVERLQQQQQQYASRFDPDDSARSKYVYGNVLLRPSQQQQQQQQQLNNNHHNYHNHHGQSSLETLRKLSGDLDRSMRLDELTNNQQTTGDGDMHKYPNEPKSKSYGRVLVSPPNLLDSRTQDTTIGQQQTNNEWTQNNKERPMGDTSGGGGGSGGGIASSDELFVQQNSGKVPVNGPSDHFKDDEWTLEPFQHIEARQLRSGLGEQQVGSDRTQATSAEPEVAVVVVQTTMNPKQASVVD